MALINSDVIPASAPAGAFTIDQSLRFNDDDSANLYWTPSSSPTGGSQTYTISFWTKLGNMSSSYGGNTDSVQVWFHARTSGQYNITGVGMYFNQLQFYGGSENNESNSFHIRYSGKLLDPSAWYHIVMAVDTTQATADNRVKCYLNGEQITSSDCDIYRQPPQNNVHGFGKSGVYQGIGREIGDAQNELDGYLAEYHAIDGQQLDASYFGETGTYGEWKPIEYSGTYGTNGFYLPFEWNPTYGSSTLNTNDIFGDSSIIATYQLNSNADDLGSNYDATATSINWVSGKFGNAAGFASSSGTNNSSVINTGGISGLTSTFSVSMWVNLYTDTNYRSGIVDNTNDNAPKIMTHENEAGIAFGEAGYRCNTGTLSTGQWYHLVFTLDGTNGKIYKDGSLYSTGTFSSTYNTGHDFKYIGHSGPYLYNSNNSFRGAIDQLRIFNRAVTASEVTELYEDGDTPITSGAFYYDASGNSNNFTETNLSETDVVVDSPTNNFCTLNAVLDSADKFTLSQGNLRMASSSSPSGGVFGTIAAYSGKWYWEIVYVSGTKWSAGACNVVYDDINDDGTVGANNGIGIRPEVGRIYDHVGGSAYQTVSFSTSDAGSIIGVALDLDNGSCQFYKDGSTIGNAVSISSTNIKRGWTVGISDYSSTGNGTWDINCGQDSSFGGTKTAQGNTDGNGIGDFYYTPPSGYLALCTANLPDPAVIPSENFNTVLYTGNNQTAQSITGVGFQPDFTWIKTRSIASGHFLANVIQGTGKWLRSNTNGAESTDSTTLTSWGSDGFSVGTDAIGLVNYQTNTYVAWNWKSNGSGSSNTNGSVTTTVSANQDAGISIFTATLSGTSDTYGHGLSQAPEFVMIKPRNYANNWVTGNASLGWDYQGVLNSASAWTQSSTGAFSNGTNAVAPTSTVMTIRGPYIGTGANVVAYCFHSVDGFSKVGSYTGNGSSDGTFIYTGFRPAFFLYKAINYVTDWTLNDNKREEYNDSSGRVIFANLSNAEATPSDMNVDFVSNGIKIRGTSTQTNGNGYTIMYIAFAEQPFKYTNAK